MFQTVFQWFVLISTILLALYIAKSFIVSLMESYGRGTAEPIDASTVEPTDTGSAEPNDTGSVESIDTGSIEPTDTVAESDRPFFAFRNAAFWQIILLAAVSRVVLYGVAYLSARIFINFEGGFFEGLPELWQRSDAPHYISIVEDGYVNVGEDKVFLVFLPFYPIVIKCVSLVFGSPVFSGILVSILSFIAACLLVYEVSLLMGRDEETAFLAAKYAVLFPASMFINGSFSEGLFLLLSALFFHAMLRKKWTAAACFGLLASFTRYYGLLLAAPYAMECASDLAGFRFRGFSRVLRRVLPIFLIPVGAGLFLVVNYIVSGNFFQFLIYQREHWDQRFSFFFKNMGALAANAISYNNSVSASLFIPQVIFIFLFILIMIYSALSGFRASMLAYLGLYFLLSISARWMLSFPRYIFGAAPVFLVMAEIGRRGKNVDALMTLFCAAGLFFFTIAYACGFHVY